MGFYLKLCRFLERFNLGEKAAPSQELVEALDFLKWDIEPQAVLRAARGATVLATIISLIFVMIGAFIGWDIMLLIIIGVVVSLLSNHLIGEYPKSAARDRAVSALGAAPQLIAQLSTILKQNPNIERAVEFVTQYNEGALADDFKGALRDTWSGKSSSISKSMEEIAEKWGVWSEGLKRSIYLILSSFHEKDPVRKRETLDMAVSVTLNDFVDKMRDYAFSLHTPTLVIFSFGVMIPLIIVSLFPLMSFFGYQTSTQHIALALFASLAAVYVYSQRVLRKRPPTLSLIEVKSSVPSGYIYLANGVMLPAIPTALIALILLSIPSIFYLINLSNVLVSNNETFSIILETLNTLPMIWGFGAAIFIYYYGTTWFKKSERDRISNMENSVPDALYYLRSGLMEGKPVEETFEKIAKMRSNKSLSESFEKASILIRRRNLSLDDVLLGDESPFEKSSSLLRSVLSLIASSMKRGVKFTAATCTVLIKYVTRLKRIERNMMNMLQRNLSMMKLTAVLFAPVVAAVVVVLFLLIVKGVISTTESSSAFSGAGLGLNTPVQQPDLPAPVLQLILGVYMIGLSFVLIRYISILAYGSDSVQLGMEIAKSTAGATILFTLALIVMRVMMGV
ncbi:MAG TPA: hypothetical protein VJH90_00640 [archaeon]|nr:hypothetical protein [archaeon]